MRFAWALGSPAAAVAEEAAAAERLGFDAVWVDGDRLEPCAVAAHLADATVGVRVGVTATVGTDHPVELAEQVAVADLTLNGRLVLAVRPDGGTEERLGEALDLLLDCFAAHPFRHDGPVWPTPANREGNVSNVDQRIRVTPAPAQVELPVWVAGAAGRDAATERALGVLVDADEPISEAVAWWRTVRAAPQCRRMRRAWRWSPVAIDPDAAVEELRGAQRDLDVDLVVVDAPGGETAMATVMREIRPRLQLDRLPPGLEQHWAHRQRTTGGSHG